ncbi:CarD family transcriptional regulator [Pseudoflavonifractor phocaeensis]|uniref:CarD family transcriptional regulator n=1 Tax=Pseudoflavonifractor phocaeensis TaxID=1870988 RepID=UPI001958775B|nr:CarD family transcriptional regulator [Pseudoflavonifractor phocaeensis]MBM6924334.1 CarD family transcriptional regulator [Pseudoflavonifractor phocaeensis]
MFQVGDLIVYSGSGVCRVMAVGQQTARTGTQRTYYTLRPLQGTEIIYAPVDSSVSMRPALTRGEADALIRRLPTIQAAAVTGTNAQLLNHSYQALFQSNSCTDLVGLLKCIHGKDIAARKQGKRPGKVEERYRKRAEELLYGELSAALELPVEEIPNYIRHRLGEQTEAG